MHSKNENSSRKLKNYLVAVIIYNVLVILWGAYVRATGSGAGCGSHWPLCNGQLIPIQTSIHTQIEFLHRISSGLSLPLVLLGTSWIFRQYSKGTWIRKLAAIASISIIMEALLGAALVLFELVSHDQSLKRTISISLHFANTLILLGSLVLTAASSDREGKGWSWNYLPFKRQAFLFVALFFCVGMAGSITALGDTLFPSQSLSHGIQQDWNASSHFLVKLRIIHPLLAITFVLLATPWIFSNLAQSLSSTFKYWGKLLLSLLFLNVVIGILNLVSLAPIPLQLLHLCMAVTVWIVWVIFLDQALVQSKNIQTL